jgi:hypothetical protein
MPVDILSPLSKDSIATIDGYLDVTVWYDLASSTSVQCFCDAGSPDSPATLSGNGLHTGTVRADLPSGAHDVFVKVNGSEADREDDVDVTIGGLGKGKAPPGKHPAFAEHKVYAKIKELPLGWYRVSGSTTAFPAARHVICIVCQVQMGKPRVPIKTAIAIPNNQNKWSLKLRIGKNTKTRRYIVRVLYLNDLDRILHWMTLVAP